MARYDIQARMRAHRPDARLERAARNVLQVI